jgi:hypothetical protein
VALLTTLALGCGSTADNRLVLRFIGFNGTGITQQDSVRPTGADVDVIQDLCSTSMAGVQTFEPFTATTINATFRDEQATDIQLDSYIIHFNDARSGVADISGSLNGSIIGGRCSSSNAPCAVDADCVQAGTGTSGATCDHTDTQINGILLFDFSAKAHVSPQIFGEATSLTITFFGSDANRSFETTAGYVVIFDDYDHCTTTTGGTGAS